MGLLFCGGEKAIYFVEEMVEFEGFEGVGGVPRGSSLPPDFVCDFVGPFEGEEGLVKGFGTQRACPMIVEGRM